jgi:hypothetical protein
MKATGGELANPGVFEHATAQLFGVTFFCLHGLGTGHKTKRRSVNPAKKTYRFPKSQTGPFYLFNAKNAGKLIEHIFL